MFTRVRGTPPATPTINPSALYSYSLSFPVGRTPSSPELGQDGALYSFQNSSLVQHGVRDEGREEHHPNTALPFPPEPFNGARPNIQKHKPPLGKGFPFKLYLMLEDKLLQPYIGWSKSKGMDTFLIPNIEAFVANALPKHFEDMTQWGSFQKQLNNYGFKRQDRGPHQAEYAHPEFLQGRPEILANVRRRLKCRTPACPGQKRPSTPGSFTASNTAPASGSQTDSPSYSNQLDNDNDNDSEELRREVSRLKRELTSSKEHQLATDIRLQAAEAGLRAVQEQLKELMKKPGQISTKDDTLNSVVDPGPAQSVHYIDVLHSASVPSPVAGDDALGYQFGSLHSLSSESYLTTEMVHDPVNSLVGLEFLAT